MFKRQRLINFRQHRDLELTYLPGVNTIRGQNEAGKTTLLEAAAYTMFGSRLALRESLDQVVTYGEKVSTLKTELDVEINGVTYCGKRSKAGAEVWLEGGAEPLVVGQDECTKFFESILGVSGKVASDLMLANQTSIRGALEGGANAPVLLIEKLANFSVIDRIISLVKEDVPNGQLKPLSLRIADLQARLDAPVEDLNVTALKEAFDAADLAQFSAKEIRDAAQKACDAQRPRAEDAQRKANEVATLATRTHDAKVRVAQTENALAQITVPEAPDAQRIAALRRDVEDEQRLNRAWTARKLLDGLLPPDAEWDEGMEKLLATISQAEASVEDLRSKKAEWQQTATRKEAMLIKETSCAFCAKDLTDVPEVGFHNAGLQQEIASAKAHVQSWQEALNEAEEEIDALRAVVAESNIRDRVYQRCAEFITLDDAFVPARWTWTGPSLTEGDRPDVAGELRRLEQQQRNHDQLSGAKAQAEQTLAAAQAKAEELAQALQAANDAAAAVAGELETARELANKLAAAEVALRDAQQAVQTARGAHETALAVQRERQAARERLQADLDRELRTLEDTAKGNRLLEKLQGARPQIADRLWKVVLTSVSTYFSTIRGKASIVTREDNGFRVDGQPVEGLSGSTLDALGLAIRVALVKTFLPNCGFMVLDEPAAACDDGRETNMLGLVASIGFDQIVLVTHSDLSDAFAQQVIQL
jgi:exonuclease SbcC